MLGHASAAMTLDVYAGLFDDDLDAVADRLDAAQALPQAPPREPMCPHCAPRAPLLRSPSVLQDADQRLRGWS